MVKISSKPFGTIGDENGHEREITGFTLTNCHDASVTVMTYGATLVSVRVPDRNHIMGDVVMGFDGVQDYVACRYYVGATVGRVANRIAAGKFCLDEIAYQLSVNSGPNHLHGGVKGFDKVVWTGCIQDDAVIMSYTSKDGEEGYPGEVKCCVRFQWTDDNALGLTYSATTNKASPVSLTNHSYFNLSGRFNCIDDHVLMVNANSFTPKDNKTSVPTGEIASVDGTEFDLRLPIKLGSRLATLTEGYDHNFCLAEQQVLACRLHHPGSGRTMEVTTTMPGLQVYTSNFLPEDDSLVGKEKIPYKKRGAICLETQHFPDAVNQANFPNSVLRPLDMYNHTTVYKFLHD